MNHELEDAVIRLHDIARLVEQQLGKGTISEDLRKAADQLNEVIHEVL